MAGLADLPLPRERDQVATLAEMRWQLFTRSLRSTDSKVAFAFRLTGKLLVVGAAIGAGIGSGFAAYFGYQRQDHALTVLFITIFVAWQSLSLLRGTSPHGVESELLRFPLRLRTYIGLWISVGLFEGTTILGTVACLGLMAGLLMAGAGVPLALSVSLLFLACNFVASRAMFLWMNRWLAKRRTREFVLILASVVGLVPRMLQTGHYNLGRMLLRLHLPAFVMRTLHVVPPLLAGDMLLHRHASWSGVWLAAWTAALGAVLFVGLRRAFLGEHLQEFAAASEPQRLRARAVQASREARTTHPAFTVTQMEWSRLRHSGSAIYQIVAPLLFVAIFGARLAAGKYGSWVLPAAVAYIGLNLRGANAFGSDGAGVQCFLLLPVPMRAVLMGKNLFAASLYAVQIIASALLVLVFAHHLQTYPVLFTLVWAVCFMAVCFSLGNQRSLRAPFLVATEQVSFKVARTSSRGAMSGGWVILVMSLGTGLLGALIVGVALWTGHPVLAPVVMLPFTIAAVIFYARSLRDPVFQGDIAAGERLMDVVARTA